VRGTCNAGRFGRLAKRAAEEGRTGNRTGKTHAKGGINLGSYLASWMQVYSMHPNELYQLYMNLFLHGNSFRE
jgi:hypothetical protein